MKYLFFFLILSSFAFGMEEIAIVDFGSQTAHLIARRLRRMGVETRIVSPNCDFKAIGPLAGIVFSGGPASVYDQGAPSIDRSVFSLNVPILGICYGWQLMAYQLGGKVERIQKEYGIEKIDMADSVTFLSFEDFNLPSIEVGAHSCSKVVHKMSIRCRKMVGLCKKGFF